MKNNILLVVAACILLTSCGGSSGYVVEAYPVNPVPSLVSFDLVDSYGVDTATSNWALEIDPDIDNGLFDLRWRVNSLEDYEVNVRVSATADTYNSILIYSEVCGAGLGCDQRGNLICEYTLDYELSCGVGLPKSIRSLPRDVYIILQVCDLDSFECVTGRYPVSML